MSFIGISKSTFPHLILGLAMTSATMGYTLTPPAFVGAVNPGSVVEVTTDIGAYVTIYKMDLTQLPPAATCDAITVLSGTVVMAGTGDGSPTTKMGSTSQKIDLATKLTAGERLCLAATKDAAGADGASYSSVVTPVSGAAPVAPTIKFADSLTANADTIWVQGVTGATVYILSFSADYVPLGAAADSTGSEPCVPGDIPFKAGRLVVGKANATNYSFQLPSAAPLAVQLHDPLEANTQLCLMATTPGPSVSYSYFASVQSPTITTAPAIVEDVVGGTSAITVTGSANASVSVYQFDAGYAPISSINCSEDIEVAGHRLAIAQSGKSTATNYSAALTGSAPYSISLAQPLVAGTQLCLAQTAATSTSGAKPKAAAAPVKAEAKGKVKAPAKPAATPADPAADAATSAPTYSAFRTVADPNSYGLVRTFYTIGAVASNQLSSSNSTNAAQYIDMGFAFDWRTEHPPQVRYRIENLKKQWGITGYMSGRFSTVPVTASTKSSSTSSSASSTGLNILSSQESARVLAGAYLPFVVTHWKDGNSKIPTGDNEGLIIAPIAKSSFTTLLNPSATATTITGASQSVSFSPTYNDWAVGGRVAWREYYASKNLSPQTWMQIDVTLGKYSNLQSIQCQPQDKTVGQTKQPTTTSCYLTVPAVKTEPAPYNAVNYTVYGQYRKSVPRLEVSGFARFKNTPFVLGIDANLAQYSIWLPKNLDTLNRAGSDVRIYFGVSGTLADLFKGLKLSTP